MKVEWIGHACFCITNREGVKIITDPYETGLGGLIKYGPVNETADVVTISHEHGDHNHVSAVSGSPEIVRGAGKTRAKGLEFRGIASHHDQAKGAQRGANTIFTFEVDGIRLTHLGDLGHSLSTRQLAELEGTEILFAPTGGAPATLDLEEAVNLWESLGPRVVFPMHFRNAGCTFPKHDIDDLLSLRPDAKKAMTSSISLAKDDLPVPVQILILDPSR